MPGLRGLVQVTSLLYTNILVDTPPTHTHAPSLAIYGAMYLIQPQDRLRSCVFCRNVVRPSPLHSHTYTHLRDCLCVRAACRQPASQTCPHTPPARSPQASTAHTPSNTASIFGDIYHKPWFHWQVYSAKYFSTNRLQHHTPILLHRQ